jgi:predicted MFS family arabinose efflux permease
MNMVPEKLVETAKPYAGYALLLLMLTYTASYLDRQILSILLEPIKRELHLSDSSLGFLTGFSFALFYATLGVPIAILADRSSRRNIVALSLVIFSAMTLLCGFVTNYWQLVMARVGVGAGEAGTSPASHAMIADLYPPRTRASAMGRYAIGINLGTLIAFSCGGWIAHTYGWRIAFAVMAIPGLALATLVRFTLKEPPRGHSDGFHTQQATPAIWTSFKALWAIPSYRHVVIGVSLAVFAWYGVSTWAASFLVRSFHMSLAQVGLVLALIIGIGGGIGTFSSGFVTDWLVKRDIRWNMWLLCLIQFICFPFAVGFYLSTDHAIGLSMFLIPAFFGSSYIAGTLSVTQALAPIKVRALASSIYLLIVNLIGQGLGSQVVGILSDLYRPRFGAESLRYALLSVTLIWVWSAIHFWMASRTLPGDIARAQALNAQGAIDA